MVALAAQAVTLLSFLVPWATFDATATREAFSTSVLAFGDPRRFVESIVELVLPAIAAIAAVALLVGRNRVRLGIASGVLLAFGIQEAVTWFNTAAAYLARSDVHLALGVPIGIGGALMLLTAGWISAVTLMVEARGPR